MDEGQDPVLKGGDVVVGRNKKFRMSLFDGARLESARSRTTR